MGTKADWSGQKRDHSGVVENEETEGWLILYITFSLMLTKWNFSKVIYWCIIQFQWRIILFQWRIRNTCYCRSVRDIFLWLQMIERKAPAFYRASYLWEHVNFVEYQWGMKYSQSYFTKITIIYICCWKCPQHSESKDSKPIIWTLEPTADV